MSMATPTTLTPLLTSVDAAGVLLSQTDFDDT